MNKVLIFVLGAAAGSLVTWKILEDKYNKIIEEEVEAVEEYYREREEIKGHIIVQKTEEQVKEEKKIKEQYENTVEELGYTVETEVLEEQVEPYVIAPEEFGEAYGHETKSFTYYADGILTDEVGEIISDPDVIIGDGLEHFGEYEDDSVYVRNENTECDYEILKHEKAFSEINGEEN